MNLEKHRFNFFPEMSEEDFSALKSSISKGFNASLGSIILYEGKILDGWNRYRACLECNIEPVFEDFIGTDNEAFTFSINANQDRRHLTKSQLATIAVDAEPLWKAIQENVEKEKRIKVSEARQKAEAERKEKERQEALRKAEAIKRENERIKREKELKQRLQHDADERERQRIEAEKKRIQQERENERLAELERIENEVCELIRTPDRDYKEVNKSRKATKLGNVFGVNNRYIEEAKKLKENNPEAFDAVKRGDKTITEVKKELNREKLHQKKQEYQQRLTEKKDNNFKVDIFNTKESFRVIYADPAWSYNDKQDTPQLGGAAKHYDTMSISQLCALPVSSISQKESVLFLWVTSPLLEDAFKVINAWGFKYKTSFIWDKVKHNMGHYNSVRHEILLISTKGNCTPDNKKLYDSVQSIERNNIHSEKPIEFLNIIDDLYNFGNRIELFCRKIKKENWYGWGNEL